jgi:DNA-binding CsgD family transcriptional regulator
MERVEALDQLEAGREAFGRLAWTDSYDRLSAADEKSPLEPDDLVRLAMSAYMTGRDEDSIEILTRAYKESEHRNDARLAVRCAFWVGFQLITKGDMAQAGGWFARAGRLLDEDGEDCVERGYLLVPVAIRTLFGGDAAAAFPIFDQAFQIGRRFGDTDLATLAGFGRGQSLIRVGRSVEGMTTLDEIMIAVTAGEVSAMLVGLVYCGVISACQDVFDLRRAREWTTALSDWCAAQPDLVPYRGQCLVHRSQIMQLHGAWSDAMAEAQRAREQLFGAPDRGSVGMAFYELGELHRLQGDFAKAEDAYRQASRWGHSPQPGLAKLRLAQGNDEAAAAAIRREADEASDELTRAKLLPAHVEIMLAAGDAPAARVAAEELETIAADFDSPFLRATSAHALGAVLLAEGDPHKALVALRDSFSGWRELDAPYETARTRVLIGLACRALGDEDTAEMELDAARLAFQQLGAKPDLKRVHELSPTAMTENGSGLTGREVEVLALVATGKSNRDIAADLVISEKTVARHVSNIFTKLGVSSRAAATAYAYKHDLA